MRQIAMGLAGLLLAACQTSETSSDLAQSSDGAADSQVASSETSVPIYVTAVCGDCHAVTDNSVSPNPQAPGFADIANSPGVTRASLVAFLSDAHNYPMQMDVDLDEKDIEDIADYMITLQSDDYHRTPS